MDNKKLHLITYDKFLELYPYFTSLDIKFPEELFITTMTITGLINNNNIDCEYVNSESNILKLDNEKDKNDKVILRKKKLKHILDTQKLAHSLIKEVIPENNFINEITCGNEKTPLVSIKEHKKHYNKIKNEKKKRENFFDQITIKIQDNINEINITLKLFDSGSIHMTGSKNLSSVYWVLYRLFHYMKFYGFGNFGFKNISELNIEMINCKVVYPFIIDRYLLYKSIIDGKDDLIYESSYDPLRHSAVHVKVKRENKINKIRLHDEPKIYNTNKKLTIMMYEYGCGIISGAINYNEIIYAYQTFYNYLLNHQSVIIKYQKNINYKEIISLCKNDLPEDNDEIIVYNEEVCSDNEIDTTQSINAFNKAKRKSNKKRIVKKNKEKEKDYKVIFNEKNDEEICNKELINNELEKINTKTEEKIE